MKHCTGIWIDHREAILVMLCGNGEADIHRIPSHAEFHHCTRGGPHSSPTYGPHMVVAEDRADARLSQQLHGFYGKVCEALADVAEILVMGPGEAKTEFAKVLREHHDLAERIKGVESADRMTKPQIVARVKEAFGVPVKRRMPL